MEDSWEMLSYVIEFYGNDTNGLSAYAGPGGWNDPDEVSLYHVSDVQVYFVTHDPLSIQTRSYISHTRLFLLDLYIIIHYQHK